MIFNLSEMSKRNNSIFSVVNLVVVNVVVVLVVVPIASLRS